MPGQLTYAGVRLLVPTRQAREWMRTHLSMEWVREDNGAPWPGPGLAHLGPTLPMPAGPVELGSLVWPRGACRWGYYHGLVDDASLELIRAQVSASGAPAPLPLVLDDGTRSLTTDLWMLPARPLTQIPGANGWQLLTLVDDRYRWWYRSADVTFSPDSLPWTDLYASIGAALGVSILVDAIPAAYLEAPPEITTAYRALPPLLDAVARSCGQRIVRGLDGLVRALGVLNARTLPAQNLALGVPVRAGGQMALAP